MTVLLLLMMAYGKVGEAAHEYLGIGIFVLFVLHHVLNRRWCRNLFRGSYTPFRVLQTLLAAMAGSMVSGVILSRHAFAFLHIRGGHAAARMIHMLSAYWGYVFLALHLGVHWCMLAGMAKRLVKNPCAFVRWLLRAGALLIAVYGVFAFVRRDIGTYLFLKSHFVFFDYEEPLALFLLDYTAVMGLFVYVGCYLSEGMKRVKRSASEHRR